MDRQEPMRVEQTVAHALRWAAQALAPALPERLAGERTSTARAEAEQLALWATGWTRLEMVTRLAEPLPPAALVRLQEAVAKRRAGVPLQYITGAAPFYGRWFVVNSSVLIPRPETEVLLEASLRWLLSHPDAACVFDLGTGSGVLAVSIALEHAAAQVHAADVSPEALAVARENARRLGATVRFHEGDGFTVWQQLVNSGCAPNVIVSNPPYIPSEDIARLDPEVRDHEPRLALDGGADGLCFYRRFAQMGGGCFAPGPAALFLEVGDGQADAVLALFGQAQDAWPGFTFRAIPDLRGVARVIAGERGPSQRGPSQRGPSQRGPAP